MSGLANTSSHANNLQAEATGSHPPAHKPDPTIDNAAQGGLAPTSTTGYVSWMA